MSVLTNPNLKLIKNSYIILKKNFCSQVSKKHYDIIVAGGGMVGATLASVLGNNKKLSNKKILLLESSRKYDWIPKDEYSKRVSAISDGTIKLMDSIGAWDIIKDIRAGPVKNMIVWDALSEAMITFEKENLTDTIAYIVENNLIIHAVTQRIQDRDNVTFLHEAKVKDYKLPNLHENVAEVQLENGDTYTCNLLLGCDGHLSKVRRAMGVQYISWDYQQMCVVGTLKLAEKGDNTTAWQRFLPTGPIALLPLNDSHSSVIWTTTPKHAKELLRMPEDQFVDAVNAGLYKSYQKNFLVENAMKFVDSVLDIASLRPNAVRQLPPSFIDCYKKGRAAFPVGFGHATNYVKKGVALVGDAAHRVHPLAGQGVNLGFGDVHCLNELLTKSVDEGKPLGSITVLKEYETRRQRHNLPTMLGIEGIQKIYGTEITPIVLARSLGVQVIHALNPVKNFFTAYASR